jgi:polar amino acid transport system permease protein
MIRQFGAIDLLFLLLAVRWTLLLTLAAFVGGALIGLLIAVMRVSNVLALRALAVGYIQLVQGTPLLVLLFVFFFGLSIFGLPVLPWIAATAAFSIYAGAFFGEIWRGALQSIPRTQWEAGASLGLGYAEQLRWVIVPQAVRISIPPTVGFLVQLIKNTSLAATIGFVELTREGQMTTASTFQPFAVYMTVAFLYFLLCFPLSQWSRMLERKLHVAG